MRRAPGERMQFRARLQTRVFTEVASGATPLDAWSKGTTMTSRARSSRTATVAPLASRSIVHSAAGRVWPGSRLAAPSLSETGCSGTLPSGR